MSSDSMKKESEKTEFVRDYKNMSMITNVAMWPFWAIFDTCGYFVKLEKNLMAIS
jgi:hypothetical protein